MNTGHRMVMVFACIVLCAGCASPQGMLANPTFQPDDGATGPAEWRYEDWGTDSRALYDPTGGREGTPAVGIECDTTEDRGCWMQRLALQGRKHLHVSAYYRTEGTARGDGALIRVEWWDGDGEFLLGTRLWLPPSEQWRYFEEVVTAPEGAQQVAVELFNRYRIGRVWWDTAHLREATREELLRFDDTPASEGEWGFRPSDGEVTAVNPPSFVWRPQDAAVAYELQVASEDDFKQPAYEARINRYNAHRPPHVLEPGTYHWRVRSIDEEKQQSGWSIQRSFTVPKEAVRFPVPTRQELMNRIPEGHPRLFVRPGDMDRLRELAQGPLRERYKDLVDQCERFLKSPPPTEDYEKYPEGIERKSPEWARIWRGARGYVERPLTGICKLALVWHLGGPDEYAEAAYEMLMEIAEWDPLGATGYRYNDEAGMRYAWGFSRAYTLLHDALTEQQREKCREVMEIRGRQMYEHLHTQHQHLWKPYSSHPNRAYHWLGEIGLAFYGEIPQAEEWAWFATNVFFHVYPVWGDSDGGWHEGLGYWHGYLTRITQWLDIMRATLQIDGYKKPFFSQVGYFPIYVQPPNSPRMTFGDRTGVRSPPNVRPVMTQFVQQTGKAFWADYLQRTGGAVDDRGWIGFIRAARMIDRPSVQPRSIASLPPSRLFEGTGLAYLHTDLTDSRDDVQIAFKSSPFGSWSHGNEAQNAVELYAYGDALLARSGTREIHGSAHHRGWTWQTHSCNAITVNGKGQIPHTPVAKGRVVEFVATENFDYVVGDASEAYAEDLVTEAKRHILFIKPHLVLIFDELQTPEPATFQYYLHSPLSFERRGQQNQQFDVSGERGRCRIELMAPQELQITLFEGYEPPIRPPYDQQIREHHLKAETDAGPRRQEFVALVQTDRASGEISGRTEHQESSAGHAVRVSRPDGEVIVLLHTGDEELSGWGLSTDGSVAAARFGPDGRPIDCFVTGGGQVRWHGEVITADH